MKTKHTPGPWGIAAKEHSGAFQILPKDVGDLRICTVTNASNDLANARLIASAPELLAACKAAVVCLDPDSAAAGIKLTPKLRAEALAMLFAAIAKAEEEHE